MHRKLHVWGSGWGKGSQTGGPNKNRIIKRVGAGTFKTVVIKSVVTPRMQKTAQKTVGKSMKKSKKVPSRPEGPFLKRGDELLLGNAN